MKRRTFVAGLLVAASAPVGALSKTNTGRKVIGWLGSGEASAFQRYQSAFAEGLQKRGFVPGVNLEFRYRWFGENRNRLADLAAQLVSEDVDLIIAAVGSPLATAAKRATSTIPIIFIVGGNPVSADLVESLNHSGNNLTGVTSIASDLAPKRLENLLLIVPGAKEIGVLLNPQNPLNVSMYNGDGIFQAAADQLGVQLTIFKSASPEQFVAAFSDMKRKPIDALFIAADGFLLSQSRRLAELTQEYKLPACSGSRDFTMAGGLFSYGADQRQQFRFAGDYAGRILGGEAPGDLPIIQSRSFEMVLNVAAAGRLDLRIPPAVAAMADELLD